MDNPGDDPRAQTISLGHASNNDSGHLLRDDDEGERPVGGMANLLQFLSAMVEPSGNRPSSGGGSGSGGGMRVVINGPRGVRTVQLGGPNTLGRGDTHPREGGVSRLSEYAPPDHFFENHFHTFSSYTAATTGEPPPADGSRTRRNSAPTLASYILSSMMNGGYARDPHGSTGFFDPFEMMGSGRFGDYVVNEHGA